MGSILSALPAFRAVTAWHLLLVISGLKNLRRQEDPEVQGQCVRVVFVTWVGQRKESLQDEILRPEWQQESPLSLMN